MIKIFSISILTIIFSIKVFSQDVEPCLTGKVSDLNEISPPTDYENIHVMKMCSDEDISSFIIWIKKEVKLHHHEKHTENVYILEGEGDMKLGDNTLKIKKGDWIFIPRKTNHSVIVTSETPMKVLSLQAPEFNGEDRVMIK